MVTEHLQAAAVAGVLLRLITSGLWKRVLVGTVAAVLAAALSSRWTRWATFTFVTLAGLGFFTGAR